MSQVLSLVLVLKQQFFKFSFIELINEKSQTNRDQKPNLFFYNNMINFEFRIKLVKKWQKTLQRDQYLIYRIQYNYKIADCENIHSLNPLYLPVNQGSGYIEENNGNKYLIFDLWFWWWKQRSIEKVSRCMEWDWKRNSSYK